MYELDHMLDGVSHRRHHQNLIHQAQHDRLARDMKAARVKHPVVSLLRVVLIALIKLLTG
jgi:hypothetical protein